ncbi:MAG: D-alanyl-D-alanine carboxypeptidase [Planctomycetes bacterium]|nr:D-alanyl-D-alanine carboxypeptidase [Planctomycetota bacterium]MCB9871811.1 D-alanyl-D-alanine carboxypeptidase [Planctomycetota bacterium]MCB9889683.1 D-alanyl-D-alanine carboxypeptidase [Planctomycetota bacterium]
MGSTRNVLLAWCFLGLLLAGPIRGQVGIRVPEARIPVVPAAKRPADRLDGPPLVNAAAWAIADGKTGELLWALHPDQRRPMASTTKVMTALIVMHCAAKQPKVLEETVEISAFAASTGGSTAKLRAGDRLPVGELLYGLLLPSGNDAANALAEHFGPRLEPLENPKLLPPWTAHSSGRSKTWLNFVAEMNRVAARLGMDHTRYVNPHGLDDLQHYSTPRDILRLSRAAMEFPEFRKRVATRTHRVAVLGVANAPRTMVWNNTNRLLEIAGFTGLKTGTTPRAGACLVSSAVRGDDQLLMVVLDSTERMGRYIDSRNLYRWAWTQRLAGGK